MRYPDSFELVIAVEIYQIHASQYRSYGKKLLATNELALLILSIPRPLYPVIQNWQQSMIPISKGLKTIQSHHILSE
jgi:hypothetical protein